MNFKQKNAVQVVSAKLLCGYHLTALVTRVYLLLCQAVLYFHPVSAGPLHPEIPSPGSAPFPHNGSVPSSSEIGRAHV